MGKAEDELASEVTPGVGERVTVLSHPPGVTFVLCSGTIVRMEDALYAIVRLDEPAECREADGTVTPLPEVRIAVDNLRRRNRSLSDFPGVLPPLPDGMLAEDAIERLYEPE